MSRITIQESLEGRFELIKDKLTLGQCSDFEQFMANDDLAGATQYLTFLQDNISEDFNQFERIDDEPRNSI